MSRGARARRLAPERALFWELGQLAWRPAMLAAVASVTLALVYREALAGFGPRRDALAFSSVTVSALMFHALALVAARDGGFSPRFEPRLLRLPLPTWRVVLARMVPLLAWMAAMGAAVGVVMRFGVGAPWPVLAPVLLQVAVFAWALALLWSLGRAPMLIVPTALPLAYGCATWLRRQLVADPLWRGFSFAEAAVLLAATVLAIVVAVVGVAHDRAAPGAQRRWRVARRLREAASEPRRLRGPRAAQQWMEWREKGRPMALAVGLCFAAQPVLVAFPSFEALAILRNVTFDVAFALFAVPPVAGFLHGRFDLSSRVAGLDRVRATRPLSDRALAWTLLAAVARTVLATWAAVAVAGAVVAGGVWLTAGSAALEPALAVARGSAASLGSRGLWVAVLAVLLYAWLAAGLVAAAALSGRNAVVAGFVVLPYGGLLLTAFAERIFDLDAWSRIVPALLAAAVVALPAVTIGGWVMAWRRRHVGSRAALRMVPPSVAVAWLIAALGGSLDVPIGFGLDRTLPWLLPATALCASLPVVLAPLALAWNRHR